MKLHFFTYNIATKFLLYPPFLLLPDALLIDRQMRNVTLKLIKNNNSAFITRQSDSGI
jgi:hypothetical protein